MTINRRKFIKNSLSALALVSLPRITLACDPDNKFDYVLIAEEAPFEILPGTTTPGMAFNDGFPAPILRAKQGKHIRINFINKLKEPTTIHWHGIRIDIAMDGVPFLTQPPIMPGESFVYDFVCPDAGTFWYHPHVNSLEQLSRGLVGTLIVEEEHPLPFDSDIVLQLKDWHMNKDGRFRPFSSPRQAARMGTLGNVKTVNGKTADEKTMPIFEIPAGGLIRTRFVNLDNTRVYNLTLKDFPSLVLAHDGNAIAKPYPLDVRATGAGMRMDIGFIAPEKAGEDVVIYDRKGKFNFEICRLRTVESGLAKRTAIPSLPLNPITAPDLKNAETRHFVFEWEGALSPSNADGHVNHKFWMINKRAWEGAGANRIPEPLTELELGKSYIFELHNATPHAHPIHMHGYSFTVLESDKREITPYHTDTILLAKNERAKIAFVADNPGRWMYHCHVIEHMKTGLMGYISVS